VSAPESTAATAIPAVPDFRKKVRVAVVVAIAWVALVGGVAATTAALGRRPTPGATSSLLYALPTPSESGRFDGYDRFTSGELNRLRHGHELRQIRYVDARSESKGPGVVSVNPIDRFTWGAAAVSNQNHRCYVILAEADRSQPQYGTTRYGRLPEGSPCVGSSATPGTARDDDWSVDDDGGSWLDIVDTLLTILPPAALLITIIARARRRGLNHAVRHLPLLVGATIGWFVALTALAGSLDEAWSEFGLSNYAGAAAWAALAGVVVEAGVIAALAPSSASLEARVGFGVLGTAIVGVPLAFIVIAASII
jgi:hypothetical protein